MKESKPKYDLIVKSPESKVINFVFNTSFPLTNQQERNLKAFFEFDDQIRLEK